MKTASSSSESFSRRQESAGAFLGSCGFNLTHFRNNPALDACPPLSLSSLSFGLRDPLSPGLECPSLPILDNCESLLIGLQRKRITWAHNDVTDRGPSPPSPPSPPPIKTKSSSAPNVLETTGLTFCSASCMHRGGHTVTAHRSNSWSRLLVFPDKCSGARVSHDCRVDAPEC